jgi:hypothetical protein
VVKLVLVEGKAVGNTYTEVLQVVNADVVAEEVNQRILEHASVTVAGSSKSAFYSCNIYGHGRNPQLVV